MTFEQLVALVLALGPGHTISLTKREVTSLFGLQTFAGINATILSALDSDLRPQIVMNQVGDELMIRRRRLGE